MKRLTTLFLMSLITLLMLSLPVLAQRGGGGGDRGRGRGGDRGGPGGSDFRARILERMDANRNGVIEPNEAQGRAGEFVARMARDAGMQPGQPLPISRLTGSRDNQRQNQGRDQNTRSAPQEDEYPTVPRFGDESIAGFGLSPLTLAGKIVDLEKKYDRRSIENAERTLSRYDKNKNGILDHSEWSGVSWRSDPRESDLDNDGILTKAEMVERFAKREERSRDERRDRGRGRGNDDERSRRGGGNERDGGRERGGRGRGGFDPTGWLTRFDRNGDGTIAPDEVDERSRGFMQRFQIDLSKPVAIEDIRRRFQGGRNGSSRNDRGQSADGDAEQPKESYTVDGSSRLKGRLSYRSQGRALPSQLPDWWDDRDGNADGQVTLREFASRQSDDRIREFRDYDLNDDGLITINEAVVSEAD